MKTGRILIEQSTGYCGDSPARTLWGRANRSGIKLADLARLALAALLTLPALLALSALLVTPARAASSPPSSESASPRDPSWVVVPVTSSEKNVEEAQRLAERLERSLEDAGADILPSDEARERFESVHSTEPVVLAPDALKALREQVQEATRYLALHRLKDALSATEKLRKLGAHAQDYLRRELDHAQELFDVCVVTASQIAEGGEQLEAYRHMLRCAQTFPGLEPQAEYHSPDVRELYNTVLENLEDTQPAELIVRSTERSGCTTRVNGISWGPAPAEIKASPTQVRVQLECGAEPGRVHTAVLRPGFNEITIDPVFDAAVHSGAPRLSLVYDTSGMLTKRRNRDLSTIADAVNASHAVALELTGDDKATAYLINTQGNLVEHADWPRPLDDPAKLDRVSQTLVAGQAPGADTAEDPSAPYRPALPIVDVKQSSAWIFPTTIALGYATSIGGTLYALADRANRREEALTGDFAVGYDSAGNTGLILAASGSALSTTMELLGLPERESIPWWAWLGGTAGLATAATGIYGLASVDTCDIGDPRLTCTDWTRDNLFGPLLLIQSAPLLTMPLTYALSSALGPKAPAQIDTATLETSSTHFQLKLRGTF